MIEKDKWFYFAGGKSAQSLEDLALVLKEIPGEEFALHVNAGKNDFANWIEGVLNEDELAAELRNVMERKDTIDLIKRHIHRHKEHSAPERIQASEEKEIVDAPVSLSSFLEPVPEYIPDNKVSEPEKLSGNAKEERVLDTYALRAMVKETKEEIEERHVEDIEEKDIEKVNKQKETVHKFVVREFIYGFVLGLIFGLIMLGALFNIKVCY